MEERRYDRQILAFGKEGQKKLSKTCVGIVGLGGTGSHIAQSLAYLGVENYILVDDDRIELTNLNRLVGAFPSDIAGGVFKVDSAKRMIQMIKPEAHVIAMPRNLRSHEAIDSLTTCSIIFGCVDHDAPRLILTELCAAYEIILMDCASEIIVEDNTLQEFGGRIVVAQPGDFCLCCANQIDMNIAREELENRETRELKKQHGYGLGKEMKAPAIISVNGVIANLAITEFICLITGIRKPNKYLVYHAERGIVNNRRDVGQKSCYTCGYITGKKDAANIKRYVLE